MLALPELRAEVERLAAVIHAEGSILPTYGRSEDGARPHVEVDSEAYHYVIVERGEELRRVTTSSLDELLELVFIDITFSLSVRFELAHRNPAQDFRRIMFQRQVDLLAMLSAEWAARERERHEAILRQHPFRDRS